MKLAEAQTFGGVHAVGNANNANYGAPAICSPLKRLDEIGMLYTSAGMNSVKA